MTQSPTSDAPPWVVDVSRHPLVTSGAKDIATRLFARIASGAYPFGTRMPAERDLADEFRETRATIRQALELLAAYDIVSRRPGSGTFAAYRPMPAAARAQAADTVWGFNINQLAETASPFSMNVAESILAPEMVRLATIYMSTRNLAELGALMSAIEAVITDANEFARLENEFMMAIAEGTHNSLIVAMYRVLHEVRRHTQQSGGMARTLTPAKIRESQLRLRSLYGALERRDVESAVEFIRLHIASNQDDMIYVS